MPRLEAEIGELLRRCATLIGKVPTIGTAESATGGRIADRLTNVPGSSDYFKGGIVSYSNDVKMRVLGVREETLKKHGAVSPETAVEMAEGGRKALKTDICVSDTGIAGPGGATPGKPVGLFYFGLAAETGHSSHKHIFNGLREVNKRRAAEAALKLLRQYLKGMVDKLENEPLQERHVVTSFLESDGKVLILKRSQEVGSYRGAWAGVSGYLERDEYGQALLEIWEETGLPPNAITLVRQGDIIDVFDANINRKWITHPFLFHVKSPNDVRTDWEHTDFRWIEPREMASFQTVPGLREALERVLPP